MTQPPFAQAPVTPTGPVATDRISSDLAAIAAALRDAAHMIDCGATVDLAGLDQAVDALCADLVGMPPADAERFLPGLELVMRDLDGLANALVAQNATTEQTPTTRHADGVATKRRRASAAYARPPSADHPPTDC